jgi:hypothetical protein
MADTCHALKLLAQFKHNFWYDFYLTEVSADCQSTAHVTLHQNFKNIMSYADYIINRTDNFIDA